jgi:hypothetical protein
MSFLTPLALLGAALAIPIILLYMLRLRRQEAVVSSTFLWQQILRDSEANTPWQRLRRNLLLLLQLIILAFLVFALARPFIIVPAVSSGQIELLLDASASMNATDGPNRSTRFEQARTEALNIINTMSSSDTMTVIRVANVPEVLVASTNDQTLLRQAVEAAQPSNAQADWVAGLTLAAADAARADEFDIVVISDGGLGDADGLPGVPGEIRYVPVGQSGENLAITALATRSLPGEPAQLFAEITNYGSTDTEVIFDLRVDGEIFTAERYTIPANGRLPIVSDALPENAGVLQAGLTLPANSSAADYLAQDNTAWTISSGSGERRVLLMSDGNLFVEQVLRSLPGIQAFRGDIERSLPTTEYDLTILDNWLPSAEELPAGDLLFINPPESTAFFELGAMTESASTIQVAENDPRMTFLDFSDVSIRQFRTFTNVEWATPLVTAEGGPLLLAGERDGRQIAVLTFALSDSDLPLQITWPILIANLMEWYAPAAILTTPEGLHIGESITLRPPFEATSIRITRPDNTTVDLPIERQTVVYGDTNVPGIYTTTVLQGGATLQEIPVVVNLFSPVESQIIPRATIALSGNTIGETQRDEIGQQEFWPIAALLALIVLLIEWYVYQRRIQARTVFRPLWLQRAA